MACKLRHGTIVAPLVAEHNRLLTEKDKIAAEREQKKKALDAHDKKLLTDYESAINRYLGMFGAGFAAFGKRDSQCAFGRPSLQPGISEPPEGRGLRDITARN